MMLEAGTKLEFKHNVFAYMVKTNEWEIEKNLLELLAQEGLYGSSLGYEATNGWLYLTFILHTAANSKKIVIERLQRLAQKADCYLHRYEFVPDGVIRFKGWAQFSHVLSPHIHVLQEKTGFVHSNEVKTFLKNVGERAFEMSENDP
jgi:hypothetical protein